MKVQIFSGKYCEETLRNFLSKNGDDIDIKFITQSQCLDCYKAVDLNISVFYEEIDELQDTGVM